MAKINSITVCDNSSHSLFRELGIMGFSCSLASSNADSIVETALGNNSCAIAVDSKAVSADELTTALRILSGAYKPEHMPLCIIISKDRSLYTDFPFVKCFRELPDREIINIFLSSRYTDSELPVDESEYITDSMELERQVTEIIQKIGIPANVKGYRYLRNAIILATKDITILDSVTKLLYPHVADDNNTTPARVERAIRHAISAAWDRGTGDVEYIENKLHFRMNYTGQRPTNSELIAMISDCMRLSSCR